LSLEPWFNSDVQVFEERLLGKWGDTGEFWKFKRGPRNTYVVTLHEDDGYIRYRAILGNIEGAYYLDGVTQKVMPADEKAPEWMYVAHFLVRLEFERDKIRLTVLNMDRLEEMIEAGYLSGAEGEDEELVIVSSTETLQSFIAEHGQDADLWDEEDWIPRM